MSADRRALRFRPWLLALLAAMSAHCQREEPQKAASAAEAVRPDDPKTADAAQRLDQIAVALEKLVVRAEAAAGDAKQLQPIQEEFKALVTQARADLGGVEKAMTPDQRRAVQAYYGQRIAPVHARLQLLLFPALLVDLPRGATPVQPVAPAAAVTPSSSGQTKGNL